MPDQPPRPDPRFFTGLRNALAAVAAGAGLALLWTLLGPGAALLALFILVIVLGYIYDKGLS